MIGHQVEWVETLIEVTAFPVTPVRLKKKKTIGRLQCRYYEIYDYSKTNKIFKFFFTFHVFFNTRMQKTELKNCREYGIVCKIYTS